MRRLAAFVIAVAFLSVAAACGGDASSERTVRFLVFGEPEEADAYRRLVDAYEATDGTADVELTVASTRSDLLTRISTSIAAGTPPELFLVNYRFFGQFASKGALEPLQPFIDDSDRFDPDDFYDVALDAFRWDGVQMCLPQNVSSLAVYYNADLFAAAGVAEPPDAWSWTEMVEAARALTVDVDDDGEIDRYGLGVEPGIVRLAPFVWSAGGELFDDDERPTGYRLDSAATIRALQRFTSLRSGAGVIPSDAEMEAESLESRFLNGRLAMFMSSRRSVPQFRSIDDFTWDVAPIPSNGEAANVLHSDAFCLTSDSANHAAAWDFVEFALGEEGSALLAATGRTVPSRIDVATSSVFLDPSKSPTRSQVFLDSIEHVRALPTLSTWPEIEDISDVLIEEAVFDPRGGEVGELIRALQTETLGAFERASDDG